MWRILSSEFAGIGQYEEYITKIEKKINDFKILMKERQNFMMKMEN